MIRIHSTREVFHESVTLSNPGILISAFLPITGILGNPDRTKILRQARYKLYMASHKLTSRLTDQACNLNASQQ